MSKKIALITEIINNLRRLCRWHTTLIFWIHYFNISCIYSYLSQPIEIFPQKFRKRQNYFDWLPIYPPSFFPTNHWNDLFKQNNWKVWKDQDDTDGKIFFIRFRVKFPISLGGLETIGCLPIQSCFTTRKL